jgi:hypothetical protein
MAFEQISSPDPLFGRSVLKFGQWAPLHRKIEPAILEIVIIIGTYLSLPGRMGSQSGRALPLEARGDNENSRFFSFSS